MSDPPAAAPEEGADSAASARSSPAVTSLWSAPPLSSHNPEALSFYRDGIATLVSGAPYASSMLRQALTADPTFVLAHIGLRVAEAVAGRRHAPAPDHSTLTRGERQHDEIIRAALGGDLARATDLRRVHLMEFPGDVLIVWLPPALGRT